jgi:hypothetical protein
MARRNRKPRSRPALPEKLQQAIDLKRFDASHRAPKSSPRSAPQRQGASRGPRG